MREVPLYTLHFLSPVTRPNVHGNPGVAIQAGWAWVSFTCRRWRSNPSGKCSQERLTRGTVSSTMRRAAHPSGGARCSAGAGCSALKYQYLFYVGRARPSVGANSGGELRHFTPDGSSKLAGVNPTYHSYRGTSLIRKRDSSDPRRIP